MHYSYDYNVLKRKAVEPLTEESNDEAVQNSNVDAADFELDDMEATSPITLLREIPEDKYSQSVRTTDDGHITLVNFDDFREVAEGILGQDTLTTMNSVYAEDSLESVFEGLCNEKFGEWEWDYDEHYGECEGCNRWKCTEDLYDNDWWVSQDDGFYCGDCVRRGPERYIEWLTDSAYNTNALLESYELESDGWEIVDTYDLYGSVPYPRSASDRKEILSRLQAEHPGAHFIFDDSTLSCYPYEYRIWAKGLSEDEGKGEGDE